MIEEIDQRLSKWITSVVEEDIEVSFLPPGTMGDKKFVGLYLKDILPLAPHSLTRRPPLQVLLRYLITSWAESPQVAHRVLGQLLFAAMENPEFEVELEPIPADFWSAFGTIPMPAFLLRLPLRVERQEQPMKLIQSPMEITKSNLVSIPGMVMGPNEIPLPNARVEISTHNLVTRTDVKGRFLFPSVPMQPSQKKVCITARSRKLFKEFDLIKGKPEPWVIHFDILEV